MTDTESNPAQRVDQYLNEVEGHLIRADVPRERRRGILDDLQSQIVDMLGVTDVGAATVRQIEAVLARLDPPDAYGDVISPAPERQPLPMATDPDPVFCPQARRGLLWHSTGLIALAVLVVGMTPHAVTYTRNPPPIPTWLSLMPYALLGLSVVGVLAGTTMGWVAIGRIKRSSGRLCGTGAAVVNASVAPTAGIFLLSFLLWYFGVIAWYGNTSVPDRGRVVVFFGGLATGATLAWVFLRRLIRYATGR